MDKYPNTMDDTQKGLGAKLPPIELNLERGVELQKAIKNDLFFNSKIMWAMLFVIGIGGITIKLWWLETFIKSICYG